MLECPRCHQSVDPQAIACPYCRCVLKAHGHPGIPLYRAEGEESLCQTCVYDADDTCTFPQRPDARECTLYSSQAQILIPANINSSRIWFGRTWLHRNLVWLVLIGLAVIALLLAL